MKRIEFRAFWAWYDFWIGLYYDTDKRDLYFCPVPTVVFRFSIREVSKDE